MNCATEYTLYCTITLHKVLFWNIKASVSTLSWVLFHFWSALLCLYPLLLFLPVSPPYCMGMHNFAVYRASCCPVGWNVTVVLGTHTLKKKKNPQTRSPPSVSLPVFCLLLFSSALPPSLDSSASVLSQALQPQGRTEWREDGWKEERGKDNQRAKEGGRECKRRTTSFAFCCAPFSSKRRKATKRRRGSSGARLYYICFIHVVDVCDISVWPVDRARLQCLEKGKQRCAAPKSTPILQCCTRNHLCSVFLFFFFASCFLTFSLFCVVCVSLDRSPPRDSSVFFTVFFLFSLFLSHLAHIHISVIPLLMSRSWFSLIETGHLRSLRWHWEAKLP